MKQVFAERVGSVIVRDVDAPTLAPGEVRVNTLLAGICGSDLHAVEGHHPLLPPPYIPGHEAVGIVESVADDVTDLAVGTRVMLKPNLPCGECENCTSGRDNACQTLAWVGCDPSGAHPGAMADLFTVRRKNVFEVPEGVTDEQAALVECFSTPVHAARIAGDITGRRTVVMGAGTIGILMLIAARNAGAGPIVVTDLDPSKRERALRLGATAAIDGKADDFADQVIEALGGRAEVIFDCVAMEASARQWTSVVRRAATIVVVGVPPRDFVVPMPLIQDWELRVQGSAAYCEEDVIRALELGHTIPADEIASDTFDIDRATEAFASAARPTSGKVFVRPQVVR